VKEAVKLVFALLQGRTRIASPVEWADAIFRILAAGVDPMLDRQSLEDARAESRMVAFRLSQAEYIDGPGRLPPRALGISACVLVLMMKGMLSPIEVRPTDTLPGEWDGSAIRAILDIQRDTGSITVGLQAIATATDTSQETVRYLFFQSATSLRKALFATG